MSNKNETILIRIGEEEKERVKNLAISKGYGKRQLSLFIRNYLLEFDFAAQKKIDAIYQKICGEDVLDPFKEKKKK